MKNIKDFQERFERWKNGENYWDIRDVNLPKYDKAVKSIIKRDDGTYYATPTNKYAFTENVTPLLKRDLSNEATWDYKGDSGKIYKTQYTNDMLRNAAMQNQPNGEFYSWMDLEGNKHRDPRVIGMSGADPMGVFAVESALGTAAYKTILKAPLKAVGESLTDLVARDFRFTKPGDWLANRIIAKQLNKEVNKFTGNTVSTITPFMQSINNPIKNTRLQLNEPTYQVYTGPTHQISDIINNDGSVNLQQLMRIQNEALRFVPNGTIARHRLENKTWHPTDWNTFLHTRDVYKRALQYGYPDESLFSALMHDAGKLWAGDGHGPYGASIIRQIFPKVSKNQIQAIYGHMENNPVHKLTRMIKGVDIKETNPFRTQYIMQNLQNSGIKDQFDIIPFFDDVYALSPIKGSRFDNYNNYIYKLLNRDPEYGNIYIMPGKKPNVSGTFNDITNESRIFYNSNDYINTAIHEAISHNTDDLVENELTSKFIPKTDVNYINVPTSVYYTDLANIEGTGWFNKYTHNNWREMRATLNELRSMQRNINDVTDDELLYRINRINGYGQKYFESLKQLTDSSRKKWLSKFRTAYKYLPEITIPIINKIKQNDK